MLKKLMAIFLGTCLFSSLAYANTKNTNDVIDAYNQCLQKCRDDNNYRNQTNIQKQEQIAGACQSDCRKQYRVIGQG